MDRIKALTINVRGMKNKKKRYCILDYLKRENYDVVAIQESHITKDDATQWELQWGGKIFFASGTNRSLGQAILINRKLMHCAKAVHTENRIVAATVEIEGKKMLFINAYAPNTTSEKLDFFQHLNRVIDSITQNDTNIILMGDFNSVRDNNMDIITGEAHNYREVSAFNQLIANVDLHDIWRILHENDKEYTWCRQNPFTARRIDYILASPTTLPSVESAEIRSFAFSDHRAVELVLKFHNFIRGPSYWKFNNSLLKDETYVEKINRFLNEYESNHMTNLTPHEKWDLCKVKIRDLSTSYAIQKARDKKSKQASLLTRLNEIEKLLGEHRHSPNLEHERMTIKTEIEINALAAAQGAQVRSRTKFIEEGEKNTAYFFALEKAKTTTNTITSVITDNGNLITEQASILKEQTRFYKTLYQADNDLQNTEDTYIADFLGTDTTHPTLNDQEQKQCEGFIKESEAATALQNLKNGSAPGSDGLTAEFYKVFWRHIKTMLLKSFEYSFEKGHVSNTQQRGIITLESATQRKKSNTRQSSQLATYNSPQYRLQNFGKSHGKQTKSSSIETDRKRPMRFCKRKKHCISVENN